MRNHIPSLHLGYSAEKKLTDEWWKEAVNVCYYNSNNKNLLAGKRVKEIDAYAEGTFSMKGFERLMKGDADAKKQYTDSIEPSKSEDEEKIGFERLPLLPPRIRSAEALINRIPIEANVEAVDALAWEKKVKDSNFLKHKPEFERDLQDLSDQMGLGKIDLGSTRYTATPFSSSPYGLDLNEADELQVWLDVLSGLSVEAAYETILQNDWIHNKLDGVRDLWTRDQFRYAVSAHQSYRSSLTGLGNMQYVYPGSIDMPVSEYADFRDATQIIKEEAMSVDELFNKFGEEIGSEKKLEEIIGDYIQSNSLNADNIKNKDFKVVIKYIEVKSIDWVGVVPVNKNSRFTKLTTDEKEVQEFKGTKRWRQNTYCAYWLKSTDTFFGKTKLDFAYREEGRENYQSFSIFVYKSDEKSCVELSIPEQKKAQIADCKLQHAVMEAKASGMYIDLRFIKGTATTLKDYPEYSWPKLMELAIKRNIVIADTSEFDGKNDGNFKAIDKIVGGLAQDIVGYEQIKQAADLRIAFFTGVNDQLVGSAANPAGLVGMQKMLINGSTNAISFVNKAIEAHCASFFHQQSGYVKDAIKAGGKRKEAIVRLIGSKKVNLLKDLDDLPLHTMGIQVFIMQRELEREEYRMQEARLMEMGVIKEVDRYMLSAIKNPKDRMALLAVKEKQFERKMKIAEMERNEQAQVLMQQQGQNQQNLQAAKSQSEKDKIYAQGEVSAKILELAAQLGMNEKQSQALIDKNLQQDRNRGQLEKNVRTMQEKQNLENQQPFA